jgi:hypothetical protein
MTPSSSVAPHSSLTAAAAITRLARVTPMVAPPRRGYDRGHLSLHAAKKATSIMNVPAPIFMIAADLAAAPRSRVTSCPVAGCVSRPAVSPGRPAALRPRRNLSDVRPREETARAEHRGHRPGARGCPGDDARRRARTGRRDGRGNTDRRVRTTPPARPRDMRNRGAVRADYSWPPGKRHWLDVQGSDVGSRQKRNHARRLDRHPDRLPGLVQLSGGDTRRREPARPALPRRPRPALPRRPRSACLGCACPVAVTAIMTTRGGPDCGRQRGARRRRSAAGASAGTTGLFGMTGSTCWYGAPGAGRGSASPRFGHIAIARSA